MKDGFYYLTSAAEPEPLLAQLYHNSDAGCRGFGFNTHDGGGFLPLRDVTPDTSVTPVALVPNGPAMNMAPSPVQSEDHKIDDDLVAFTAKRLQEALAKGRHQGRSGWQDKTQCSEIDMAALFKDACERGDGDSVIAYAAMIAYRTHYSPAPEAPLEDIGFFGDATLFQFALMGSPQAALVLTRRNTRANDTARTLEQEGKFWRANAEALWKLLDDIDTQDDAARDNDDAFRRYARMVVNRRHAILESDGYTLAPAKQVSAG